MIASANRDPAANDNPDDFDISRENIKHVSFGHGIHLCLGLTLARLEGRIRHKLHFVRALDSCFSALLRYAVPCRFPARKLLWKFLLEKELGGVADGDTNRPNKMLAGKRI